MLDSEDRPSDAFTEPRFELNDELPPVKPPSAGFILQLFLIPALIVAAVGGVVVLFGTMAKGEQDWRELVEGIKSPNEHIRWRAANGLANLLQIEERRSEQGERLSRNPQIAAALADLLREAIRSRSQRTDDLNQQIFLASALGFSDVTSTTFPALQEAMQPEQAREVRRHAIEAVAIAAGRAADRHQEIIDPPLLTNLIEATRDSDALIRQVSTFALGLVPSAETTDRLTVLLNDADADTRFNAAVSLSRQESTAGLTVFREILRAANLPHASDENAAEYPMEFRKVRNGLAAIRKISAKMTAAERSEFIGLIEPIAAHHAKLRLRTDATDVLLVLKGAGNRE